MMYLKRILITGGAGFIGSHAVRKFVKNYPDYLIINLDSLTYAGNLENLKDIENRENYVFLRANICNESEVEEIFKKYEISHVLHFAAESHVDRSITKPLEFVETNVLGTCKLLHTAYKYWKGTEGEHLFYHISTDEVYGSLGQTGYFTENTAYDPRSPYSASKASSDHFIRAYHHTYQMPVVISNCSNNYGPFQFPEKLIPLVINNILEKKELPVYGDGSNVRDWLFVGDHIDAIDLIFHKGTIGETYNIGGQNELKNITLVEILCDLVDEQIGRPLGESRKLIRFVTDRPGHDQRYAIDATKLSNQLGWKAKFDVHKGLAFTIDWYLKNRKWLSNVTSGEYKSYYENQYEL